MVCVGNFQNTCSQANRPCVLEQKVYARNFATPPAEPVR